MSESRLSIVSVLAGALILCSPALLNNFPFLYADTGTYLHCGFKGVVSEIRPMLYGLFIRHVSLMESLWLVIFVQCLIVSWTIHLFYRTFISNYINYFPLIIIVVLTLATGIGEVAGMLMPDIFTAEMLLCASILLFGRIEQTWKQVLVSILLWFSVASHHSNAYILFFLLLGWGALMLIKVLKKQVVHTSLKKLCFIGALGMVGYFTIPILHYSYSGEFFWSKGKNVFLTNRINQMGLLKPFLRENCPQNSYNLCNDIEAIPYDILWDSNSPLNKTGGWSVNDTEYGKIVGDFFQEPKYLKKFFVKTFENLFLQYFTFEGKQIYIENENGYPYAVMLDVIPEQIPIYRRSMQFADRWDSKTTQMLQRILVLCSFAYLLIILVFKPNHNDLRFQKMVCSFLLIGLLSNALICSGISMVDIRFQYRIIWLVPFLAMMIAADQFIKDRSFNNQA